LSSLVAEIWDAGGAPPGIAVTLRVRLTRWVRPDVGIVGFFSLPRTEMEAVPAAKREVTMNRVARKVQ